MGPFKDDEISFREHFEELLKSSDKLADERWSAHERVHTVGQKAMDATVESIYLRLEQMNKFREDVVEDRADFVRNDIYAAAHTVLQNKLEAEIESNRRRLGEIEKFKSNLEGRFWMLGIVLLAINATLALVLRFWIK